MSECETGTELGRVVDDFRQAEPRRQTVAERAAAQKFERQERRSVPIASLVYGRDSRMVQGGDCLRFALEPLKTFRTAFTLIDQELERDDAVEASIPCPVDQPHSTLAAALQYLVMRVFRASLHDRLILP